MFNYLLIDTGFACTLAIRYKFLTKKRKDVQRGLYASGRACYGEGIKKPHLCVHK
jgi:hypothetical protein